MTTFILGADLKAQEDVPQSEFISFDADFASFGAQEGYVHLEVYLLVSRKEFSFEADGDKFISRHNISVEILRDDSLLARDTWDRTDRTEDKSTVLATQLLPDYSSFIVPPGTYNLRVTFTDRNSGKIGTRQEQVVVQEFDDSELVISDIEFATAINKVDKKGIFTKYGMDIIPNAGSTYGVELPVAYIYCEIYNLSEIREGEDPNYQVEYSVTNLNGEELLKPAPKIHKKPGISSIEMGGLNIISLISKGYIFRVKVTDLSTGKFATRSKRFFVYRPSDVQTLANAQRNELANYLGYLDPIYSEMTLKEINDEWDMLKLLATRDEKKLYKNSDETGRRRVMLNYWRARENSMTRDEFLERATMAKHQWSGLRDGWKTDRGRVLITYGKPDEIEREPNSINSRPFEIWRYFDIEGGVEFVFVDKQGFTDYELVHSDARNELSDFNWSRWIQVSSTGRNPNLSR